MELEIILSVFLDLNLNLLKLGFGFMTTVIVVMGSLMNTVERHLPAFFAQTFRYGKFAYKGSSSRIKPIEVPKRWFRHFYVFAAINTFLATLLASTAYFLGRQQHPWLLFMLDLLASQERKATVSALSAFLALILLTIQAWHRFYETWFVSVFSNGRINLSHYLIGYIHYFGSVAAILSEAPGFISGTDDTVSFWLSDLTLLNIFGTILFLYACYHQCKIGVLLANLRKDEKGQVVSYKHIIPTGDWFQYVSCPHLFAEVLMYLGLTFVLWGATTWPVVFFWVLCNQVETALLTHWWYQSTFEGYPQERKAIIPHLL